jgi:RimJ/RimL family protein N-acetyltransferase
MIRLVDLYRGGKIDQADVDFLYQLLAERPPEANISHRDMPTPEQHKQFVHRRPYAAWYLIEQHGRVDTLPESEPGIPGSWPVGAVYLTQAREVGIFVLRVHWGKGHARAALEELRRLHPGPILANVAPGNERSHRFFQAAGGRLISQTYEL